MGMGGWQAGLFFDLTGSYTVSFAIAAFAAMATLTMVVSLQFYLKRHYIALAANSG
jgi:hypothetical protein